MASPKISSAAAAGFMMAKPVLYPVQNNQISRKGNTARMDGFTRTPMAHNDPYPAQARRLAFPRISMVAQKISASNNAANAVSQTHRIGKIMAVGRRVHNQDAAIATPRPKLRFAML